MNMLSTSPQTTSGWSALADNIEFRNQPFIGGRFVPSRSADRIETVNPATGNPICKIPAGCRPDVDAAVTSAREAFVDGRWRDRSSSQRKTSLLRLADLIALNGDELALLDALEMGKAICSARAEISLSTDLLQYFAEATDKLHGDAAASGPACLGFKLFEPRGVVGAIVPWNFPLANAVTKVAPALATGNSIVLKPSEIASLSALRLAELAVEAGIPAGVFNVLPGLGTTIGEAMGRHPDIDFLSFTGSTATGRRLLTYSGESNGKPLILELGGKCAQIVCADMADDLEALAANIVHDAFWNQGQWCAARSRLIVDEAIHDKLIEAVGAAAAGLKPGFPLDVDTNFGTIASSTQFDRIQDYVRGGTLDGARLVFGGEKGAPCALSMAPVLFSGVMPDMEIAREEIFGPVLCAMRFSNFDEALQIANSTAYGLAATLWTRDLAQAQKAARRISAGKITIRSDARSATSASVPLGGEPWGASGFGSEKGVDGLRSYCRTKALEMLA